MWTGLEFFWSLSSPSHLSPLIFRSCFPTNLAPSPSSNSSVLHALLAPPSLSFLLIQALNDTPETQLFSLSPSRTPLSSSVAARGAQPHLKSPLHPGLAIKPPEQRFAGLSPKPFMTGRGAQWPVRAVELQPHQLRRLQLLQAFTKTAPGTEFLQDLTANIPSCPSVHPFPVPASSWAQNMQTPHRTGPRPGIEPPTFLLCRPRIHCVFKPQR